MIRALFEHKSVEAALARAGLYTEGANRVGAARPDAAAIFIGWSSLCSLLLRPEFALLSVEDVTFVRLPRTRDELRKYFSEAQSGRADAAELERLSTPLGQWRWALGRWRDALQRGDTSEAESRLHQLRRFDAMHWSGRHEERLQNFGDAHTPEAVDALLGHALEVATLEACRPLLPWASGGEKGRRIAPLLDALSYVAQGVGEGAEVESVARSDEWWSEMESDLGRARARLAEVVRGGGAVEEVIGDWMSRMELSLARIREFVATAANAAPDATHSALAAAETLASVPSEIRGLYTRIGDALRKLS